MRIPSRLIVAMLLVASAVLGLSYVATSQVAEAQTSSAQPARLQLDYTNVVPAYANFARVTGTADEVVVDFALIAAGPSDTVGPIRVHQQTVMNVYTLKRLTASLQTTLERHEAQFGPIELDVEKRIKN